MAKAQVKTKVNDGSVQDFLNRIGNAKRREDAFAILKMMQSVTRKKPRMWGSSIVGFDEYHYKYASGREGDICMIGFSPRSQAMTLYLGDLVRYAPLLGKLDAITRLLDYPITRFYGAGSIRSTAPSSMSVTT